MTLFEKIKLMYPELTTDDFSIAIGSIHLGIGLQNDSDGRGDYIADWSHPTLPKPTQAQLDAIK